MTNTLGLDDDLDGAELVQDVQQAFDILITNADTEQTYTVGELFDLLLTKVPVNETDRKCASAMTFYRLRGGLKNLGFDAALLPSTNLQFLDTRGVRRQFKFLERETGLRLPRVYITRSGLVGCMIAIFGAGTAFVESTFFSQNLLSSGVGLGFCVFIVGTATTYFDPGKLPEDCSTLGGLAKKTAPLNFGRLAEIGARHREVDIWNNLIELLSVYRLPKEEINRDTVFLKSEFDKREAVKSRVGK